MVNIFVVFCVEFHLGITWFEPASCSILTDVCVFESDLGATEGSHCTVNLYHAVELTVESTASPVYVLTTANTFSERTNYQLRLHPIFQSISRGK